MQTNYEPTNGAMIQAQAQRFEQGIILMLRVPRVHAPNVWYLLAGSGSGSEKSPFWWFITPIAFFGLDVPVYHPGAYNPPAGYFRPDRAFGSLWVKSRHLLGWAIGEVRFYPIPYGPDIAYIPYIHPPTLIGPDGMAITFG